MKPRDYGPFDYSPIINRPRLTWPNGERVALFEFDDKHGFSKPRREAATRWMRRWLLGIDDAVVELTRALTTLNPRMRLVLERRFGLAGGKPETLEEVGATLGITRERVRQLESRALRELRATAPDLELYLRTE